MKPQNVVTVLPDGRTRVGLEPWPKELHELAFELWMLKFNRNMNDVADYLNGLPDQDIDRNGDDLSAYDRDVVVDALQERVLSVKTLYSWKRQDKWDELADTRHRQLAPALYARVDHGLEVASIGAMETLIELSRDKTVAPKVRLDAANSILDRTGHTAWVRPSDDGKVAGPQRDYSEAIAGKDATELLRLITGTDAPVAGSDG